MTTNTDRALITGSRMHAGKGNPAVAPGWGAERAGGPAVTTGETLAALALVTMPHAGAAARRLSGDRSPERLTDREIVAAALLVAHVQRLADGGEVFAARRLEVFTREEHSEYGIVAGLLHRLGAPARLRLVTWSGERFDLPLLRCRALRHWLTAPALFPSAACRHFALADVLAPSAAFSTDESDAPGLREAAALARLPEDGGPGMPPATAEDDGSVRGLALKWHEDGDEAAVRRLERMALPRALSVYGLAINTAWLAGSCTPASIGRSLEQLEAWLGAEDLDAPDLRAWAEISVRRCPVPHRRGGAHGEQKNRKKGDCTDRSG